MELSKLCHEDNKKQSAVIGKRFKSYRCGENTWMDTCGGGAGGCDDKRARNFISTAGRVDNAELLKMKIGADATVTVGKYDPKDVPAVNIFGAAGCNGASRRLYSSADADERTVEYSQNMVEVVADNSRGPKFAMSAMVPHGYRLSVYSLDGFKGLSEDYYPEPKEHADGKSNVSTGNNAGKPGDGGSGDSPGDAPVKQNDGGGKD